MEYRLGPPVTQLRMAFTRYSEYMIDSVITHVIKLRLHVLEMFVVFFFIVRSLCAYQAVHGNAHSWSL